jgi:hypothetical protein
MFWSTNDLSFSASSISSFFRNFCIIRDPNLLPGYNLCFVFGDTGRPETADAMKIMTHMRDGGVDAFVGLEHSCAQEAFLATAWDVPLISYVSSNKTTRIRVS